MFHEPSAAKQSDHYRRKLSDNYMVNCTTDNKSMNEGVPSTVMSRVTNAPPLQARSRCRNKIWLKNEKMPILFLVAVGHIQAGTYQSAKNSLLKKRSITNLLAKGDKIGENLCQRGRIPNDPIPHDLFAEQDAIAIY